ncbi:hypothetical protein SAMN05421829_108128 [Aromatoleum tolulyticum]|uniref:Uncharacterized protein n=1 Tax=Aromatoleum tolulyticum TaxID=34027 RepID=A0A1N6WYZ2_9RHOO|nr:hypothetical protein [Aromatoleum tolulyticum]SIQ95287.1 hypothetical protein SAMN05421829_108128 [Aromatoleum tolulyticum]
MELNELRVDVIRLCERAVYAGWGLHVLRALWAMAEQPVPEKEEDRLNLPMQSVSYEALCLRLNGYMRLAAVDSLANLSDADRVKVGGVILLAMANRIFLPHVPAEHAARQPTEALLGHFSAWLVDGAPAEQYVAEAYRYRSRFGTTVTAIRTDPEYEELFDAMPSAGLDYAMGEGHWDLSSHWHGFGRFLAAQGADWQALRVLEQKADGVEFVSDDEYGNDEAHAALLGLLDAQRDGYVDVALKPHDAALAELVDGVLATLRREPARAA